MQSAANIDLRSSGDSQPIATLKPRARSRVSNGSQLLAGIDGRSAQARRYRDILAALREHLGGNPSAAQDIIARRAATLAAWAEAQEATALAGEAELDINQFVTATNSLRRLVQDLGLQSVARDVTPSLARYLDVLPAPLASPLEAVTLDPVHETHEEPERIPEPSLIDLGVIPAGVTDGEPGEVDTPSPSAGLPLAEPEPIPGDTIDVPDSRAKLVYAPRQDGEPRWAICADGQIKGYVMDRAEGERLAREKLKPMTVYR
jgi:hypothetical protein